MAVRTAGENAALNGVLGQAGPCWWATFPIRPAANTTSSHANIVANAFLSLAPAVPGLMAEGATFIASGIIDSRKYEVIAGLEKAGLALWK